MKSSCGSIVERRKRPVSGSGTLQQPNPNLVSYSPWTIYRLNIKQLSEKKSILYIYQVRPNIGDGDRRFTKVGHGPGRNASLDASWSSFGKCAQTYVMT